MPVCSICQNIFSSPSKYYTNKTCSKNCRYIQTSLKNKGSYKGITYEKRYGKEKALEIINRKIETRKWYKHSEETKRKIGLANQLARPKKIRIKKLQIDRKGHSYEEIYGIEKANTIKLKQKLKGGVTKKGKTYEQIYGLELAQKLKKNLHDKHLGKLFKRKCKGFYHNGQLFRSSWEKAFAIYCENNNIEYIYEPKIFDLGTIRYIPDFYLPIYDLWVEIKGWWKKQDEEKCKLFKQQITPRLFIIDRTNYITIDNNYKIKDCSPFNLLGEYNISLKQIIRCHNGD